ncbi:alpha/beta-hydrolase [Trametes elegans]|nr:alpha/beta-hydrolase [Trametes elegans]
MVGVAQLTLEIAYGPEASHRFDYYPPASRTQPPPPLLVFVHGGAWRSEDKADHAALARALLDRAACAVAVPNYRLTTPAQPIQHPSHAEDVLRCLHFLATWPGPSPSCAEPAHSGIYVLGHSCSAHILASIYLASPYPELTPSRQLLASTRALAFSEGIYDIDALLRSFPNYKQWFVASAFGDRDAYEDVNVASYPPRPDAEHLRWLVIHSTGDTLVDPVQSESMYAHLSALFGHVQPAPPVPPVQKNFDELDEGHNDLLSGVVYPRIIADFVAQDCAP